MKIIVIGLDGANFELIQPWIEAGKLPTLKKLIDSGCSANQQSCLPPVTAPNWKCYSTGKNPGKLGIFWWENIDLRNKRVLFPISRVNKSKEIWDFIGENGGKVGVINMPLTYPPKKVKGFVIAGGSFAQEHEFTYPRELENTLRKEFDYKVFPKDLYLIKREPERVVKEVLRVIESRFKVARKLLTEYDLDFLHVTTFFINTLHHNFWNDRYVEEAWQLIDKNIGCLLEGFEDTHDVFLISDHGSNKIDQVFYINNWLAKEGYLRLSSSIRLPRLLYALGINQQSATRMLSRLHLRALAKVLPSRIKDSLPSEAGTIDQSRKTDKIVWDMTKAVASGQGPVYINLKGKEKENTKEELLSKLENLQNPKTGKNIARKVYRKEEIYSGKYLAEAPDLIIDQNPGTHIRGGIGIGKINVFEEPHGWKAENKREGIFIACGPNIQKIQGLDKVSILDLAPTILHLMNIPVPKDMDGRVLSRIFAPNSDPARRRVRHQKVEDSQTQQERESIKRGIRKLQQFKGLK
ncbi:alkaline phosphatase family protein [Chloroflexota bacterium]